MAAVRTFATARAGALWALACADPATGRARLFHNFPDGGAARLQDGVDDVWGAGWARPPRVLCVPMGAAGALSGLLSCCRASASDMSDCDPAFDPEADGWCLYWSERGAEGPGGLDVLAALAAGQGPGDISRTGRFREELSRLREQGRVLNCAELCERKAAHAIERACLACGGPALRRPAGDALSVACAALDRAMAVALVATHEPWWSSLNVKGRIAREQAPLLGPPRRLRADSTSARVATSVLCRGAECPDLQAVSLSYPVCGEASDMASWAFSVAGSWPEGSRARSRAAEAEALFRSVEGARTLKEAREAMGRGLCLPLFDARGRDTGAHVRFSLGGLHGALHDPDLARAGSEDATGARVNWFGPVAHADFSSYYPHLLGAMGAFPGTGELQRLLARKSELGDALSRFQGPRDRRALEAERASVKLVLNAATGAAARAKGEGAQPLRALSARLVGQLILWRLAQGLALKGMAPVSVNTDGLYVDGPVEAVAAECAMLSAAVGVPVVTGACTLASADANSRLELDGQGRVTACAGPALALALGDDPSLARDRPQLADAALARYLADTRGGGPAFDRGAAIGALMACAQGLTAAQLADACRLEAWAPKGRTLAARAADGTLGPVEGPLSVVPVARGGVELGVLSLDGAALLPIGDLGTGPFEALPQRPGAPAPAPDLDRVLDRVEAAHARSWARPVRRPAAQERKGGQ